MPPRRPLLVALAVAALLTLTGCASSAALAPPVTEAAQLTDDDGYIPDGSSLTLDSDLPAVRRLDPALLDALRSAAAAASDRGTAMSIVDGWRSERYQEFLFAQAVRKYDSEGEASRWVKRGADSAHVSGKAVDIQSADAMDFLSRFGSEWGLCQTYTNERWHFELLTGRGGDCPAPLADGRG